MLTVILPGYSSKNREWLDLLKKQLKVNGRVVTFKWPHWEGNETLNIKNEAEKIIALVGNQKVNFIAKSVGTRVLMAVLPEIKGQINRVILCGIPIDPVRYAHGIKLIKPDHLLIIQNSKDPFMPAGLIKIYIRLINKHIKVVEKEAKSHDYPYIDDFKHFLNAKND